MKTSSKLIVLLVLGAPAFSISDPLPFDTHECSVEKGTVVHVKHDSYDYKYCLARVACVVKDSPAATLPDQRSTVVCDSVGTNKTECPIGKKIDKEWLKTNSAKFVFSKGTFGSPATDKKEDWALVENKWVRPDDQKPFDPEQPLVVAAIFGEVADVTCAVPLKGDALKSKVRTSLPVRACDSDNPSTSPVRCYRLSTCNASAFDTYPKLETLMTAIGDN